MKVNLKKISFLFLALILALSAVLIVSVIKVPLLFQNFAKNTMQSQKIAQAAVSLQEASDYLTNESRLFTITGDWSHLENYFVEIDETKRREKALEKIKAAGAIEKSASYIEQAMNESKKLEELEYKAMKLVVLAKGYDKTPSYKVPAAVENAQLSDQEKALDFNTKMATAWLILFSDKYFSMKNAISNYRANAVEEIFNHASVLNRNNAESLEATLTRTFFEIILIVVFSLAFFLIIIFFVIKSLYGFIDNIKNKQKLQATRTTELELLRWTYNEMFEIATKNENYLRRQAEHDELTGLINRTAFKAILKALKESNEIVAFIMLDIDKFKEINDEYGHTVGDKVLKTVAQILESSFRSTDYAARLGGDEFAVVLSKCDDNLQKTKRVISAKMETLFKKLEEKCQNDIPRTTLSCGIAISKSGWNESLIEKADAALYEIKRAGRNGYKFAE